MKEQIFKLLAAIFEFLCVFFRSKGTQEAVSTKVDESVTESKRVEDIIRTKQEKTDETPSNVGSSGGIDMSGWNSGK